jgi:hypothetical protein
LEWITRKRITTQAAAIVKLMGATKFFIIELLPLESDEESAHVRCRGRHLAPAVAVHTTSPVRAVR